MILNWNNDIVSTASTFILVKKVIQHEISMIYNDMIIYNDMMKWNEMSNAKSGPKRINPGKLNIMTEWKLIERLTGF